MSTNNSKLCEVCLKNTDSAQLLYCKGCDKAFHSYCVMGCTCCHKKAPGCVKGITPTGDWYCKFCSDHFPPVVDSIKSELYGWGENSYGQLGLGTTDPEYVLTPTLVKEAQSMSFTEMTGGAHFSVLLTTDDTIYTCGDGNNGKLGHTDIIHETLTHFRMIQSLQPGKRVKSDGVINHIQCGEECSYITTIKNGIYVWGSGQYGIFGNQKENDIKKPVKPGCYKECERKVSSVSCGNNHVLLITTDGELLTVGHNDCGQLGSGDFTDQWVPHFLNVNGKEVPNCMRTPCTVVTDDDLKYTNIYGGYNYSIVKDDKDQYYGMGLSTNGQLTLVPDYLNKGSNNNSDVDNNNRHNNNNAFVSQQLKINKLTPLPLINNLHVKDVICGENHVILVDMKGNIYSYGQNNYGQLGLGHFNNVYTPTLIESLNDKNPLRICCGSNHTLLLSNDGELYSWGANNEGQLGNGNKDNSDKPVHIETIHNIYIIGCGYNHSFALINPRNIKRKIGEVDGIKEEDEKEAKKAK